MDCVLHARLCLRTSCAVTSDTASSSCPRSITMRWELWRILSGRREMGSERCNNLPEVSQPQGGAAGLQSASLTTVLSDHTPA